MSFTWISTDELERHRRENAKVTRLIQDAVAYMSKMSPKQQAEHWERQRQSFVRAMTTPCEHGELDFEQCSQCREAVE